MVELKDEISVFMRVLEFMGTFAGAISGVRLSSVKRFDWFGAAVVGLITAVGGGTLRDVLLGVTAFWMTDPFYIVSSLLAVVAVGVFGRRFISGQITWFIFDTVSISLFMMVGVQKSLLYGQNWWCAIILGLLTAVAGGIMRDICINEVPLIFRKELYALACAAGGFLYFALPFAGIENFYARNVLSVLLIFVVRALAIKFHLGVPVLSGHGTAFRHHRRSEEIRDKSEEVRVKSEEIRAHGAAIIWYNIPFTSERDRNVKLLQRQFGHREDNRRRGPHGGRRAP